MRVPWGRAAHRRRPTPLAGVSRRDNTPSLLRVAWMRAVPASYTRQQAGRPRHLPGYRTRWDMGSRETQANCYLRNWKPATKNRPGTNKRARKANPTTSLTHSISVAIPDWEPLTQWARMIEPER